VLDHNRSDLVTLATLLEHFAAQRPYQKDGNTRSCEAMRRPSGHEGLASVIGCG
jgi:hypothetical protein